MKRAEGSYTVEITLLLPLMILAMFLPVYKSFDCYKEVKQESAYVWKQDFVPEEKIRKMQLAKDIWEEIK
ncbi:MAG: hypothetical protein NC307_08785 [Roseburia sp.]|nr:hypothetical protein [Roseburia sp.]